MTVNKIAIASLGQTAPRREFRRLLGRPAILFCAYLCPRQADRIWRRHGDGQPRSSFRGLLRLGIAGELINATAFIFVVFALYRLFKGVNKQHASLMLTLFVISVPISFLNVLNDIAALIFASGAPISFLYLKRVNWMPWSWCSSVCITMDWSLPRFSGVFGYFRSGSLSSGFFSRVFVFLLFIAGSANVASSFTSVCLPQDGHLVGQVTMVLELGELPIIFWLLIWGQRIDH